MLRTGLVVRSINYLADRVAELVAIKIGAMVNGARESCYSEIGKDGKIDRNSVIVAYRFILGREPENERVIAEKLSLSNIRSLVFDMLQSQEFKDQCRSSVFETSFRKELKSPKYVMTELDDGLRFWINLRDVHVSRGILLGMWEATETAFVRMNVKPGMRVVDVGANLGWFTVQMAGLVGKEGSVFAFEPRNDVYSYLCKTIEANSLTNITAYNCALGDRPGELVLQWSIEDENPGGTHLSSSSFENLSGREDLLCQKTNIKVLDEVTSDRIDFIKIDVEGAEKMVFDGASRVFEKDRPIILSEMAPASLAGVSGINIDEYFAYLRSRKYDVFEMNSNGELSRMIRSWPYGGDRDIINVVLVPKEAEGLSRSRG